MNDLDEQVAIDALAEELFAAARSEQPSAALRLEVARALTDPNAQIASTQAVHFIERPAVWAACVVFAIAAATLLFFTRAPVRDSQRFSISPDQAEAKRARVSREVALENEATSDERPAAKAQDANTKTAARAPSTRASSNVARVVPQATLADEIGALERARQALSRSDTSTALLALDDYDRVLHGTQLRAEATLLRIEALSKSGRGVEAAELAHSFDQKFPGSPLADRARAFATLPNEDAPSTKPRGTL